MAKFAADQTIRYGIIGAGMMGGEHMLVLEHVEGAEVVAFADPVATSLEWGALCAPNADPMTDYRDLLRRDDIDAIVVSTPNFTHIDVLADALETDLAVLVEKPMCTTVDDCRTVVDRVRTRDALTWVGLQYRYMPTIAALLDQLDAGSCGETKMVSIREHRFPFLQKVGDWNRFTRNTGGTLVEKCCHFFDLMRRAAGANPIRVYGSGGQDVNHLDEFYNGERSDILDNAFVIIDFANGVRGALELSMFAEGGRYEQEITITGSRGKLEATVPGNHIWFGPRDRSGPHRIESPMHPDVPHPDFHQGASYIEHVQFGECLRAGATPIVTVEDGMWAVAMGAAAHRSIDEQRPVHLTEFGLG